MFLSVLSVTMTMSLQSTCEKQVSMALFGQWFLLQIYINKLSFFCEIRIYPRRCGDFIFILMENPEDSSVELTRDSGMA